MTIYPKFLFVNLFSFLSQIFPKVCFYKINKIYILESNFYWVSTQKTYISLQFSYLYSDVMGIMNNSTNLAFGSKTSFQICENPRNGNFKPLSFELKNNMDARAGIVYLHLNSSCTIGIKYFLCCASNCELCSMTNIILIKHPLTFVKVLSSENFRF